MGLNVDLLRGSFQLALERCPDLTHRFYAELLRRHPQARELFASTSLDVQEQMLAQALVAVMDHLEDAGWLESTLSAMGARHAQYGVTTEMYDWVGECLLATIAEAAGPDWAPDLELAWTDVYAAIVELMLAGYPQARSVAPEPASG
jgi:hemoglobin-like flavoprotein